MSLVLYARARTFPVAAVGVLGVAVGLAVLEPRLVAHDRFDEMVRLPLAVAAALAGAVLAAATLHSGMEEVEASTPVPWPRWRLVHAVVVGLAAAAALALGLPLEQWGAGVLLRDVAGLWGLALLAAAALGPRLAWTAPCCFAAAAYLTGGTTSTGWRAAWGFLTQPWESPVSAVTALVLLAAGLAAWSGCAPSRA